MDYLTTQEWDQYVPGVTVDSAARPAHIARASRLVDAICRRPLSVESYRQRVRLDSNGSGFLTYRPAVALAPDQLATGLRVRPVGHDTWVDVDASSVEIAPATGRISVNDLWSFANFSGLAADSPNRDPSGPTLRLYHQGLYSTIQDNARPYEADVEYTAGWFATTADIEEPVRNATGLLIAKLAQRPDPGVRSWRRGEAGESYDPSAYADVVILSLLAKYRLLL